MSDISTTAVTSAGRPTVVSFTTLNCSPRPNMRKMTPICDQVDTSAVSTMLGIQPIAGLTRNPATTYPSTSGCLKRRQTMVGHRRHGEQQGEVVDELGYGLHRFLFAALYGRNLIVASRDASADEKEAALAGRFPSMDRFLVSYDSASSAGVARRAMALS